MKNKSATLFYVLGILISTLPVLTCVLLYFPIWQKGGSGKIISGLTLILLLFSAAPLIKILKQRLKSPSVHTLWFFVFVIFFALSSIAKEMTVISLVGFITNLIGAVFFKISEHKKKKSEDA